MVAVRLLEFKKNCHIWSCDCHRVRNLHLCTKFHRNWMIFRWDMATWWFSRRRIY